LAEAQTDLGWAYENGAGVPQDNTQAVAWYRKAAEQGHPEAKRKLESAETEIKIKQQKDEQEEEARRQQQLEDQARAGGYQKTSVETFVLDGRDLAARGSKVSLAGNYLREGNLEVLYADTRAVLMRTHGVPQPNVPLLTDDASREFRQHLLRCQSNPGSAQMGCPVTVLGRATMCTLSNAFGGMRESPCVAVDEGQMRKSH
jgi:hypothetical protein